jgi:hypothetical protein
VCERETGETATAKYFDSKGVIERLKLYDVDGQFRGGARDPRDMELAYPNV